MVKIGKPQVENGFTRIANELLEVIIKAKLSAREYAIVFFIIRNSYGFHRLWTKPVGYGYIAECTGLHRADIQKAILKMEKNKQIFVDRTGYRQRYKLQKIYKYWYDPQTTLDLKV